MFLKILRWVFLAARGFPASPKALVLFSPSPRQCPMAKPPPGAVSQGRAPAAASSRSSGCTDICWLPLAEGGEDRPLVPHTQRALAGGDQKPCSSPGSRPAVISHSQMVVSSGQGRTSLKTQQLAMDRVPYETRNSQPSPFSSAAPLLPSSSTRAASLQEKAEGSWKKPSALL